MAIGAVTTSCYWPPGLVCWWLRLSLSGLSKPAGTEGGCTCLLEEQEPLERGGQRAVRRAVPAVTIKDQQYLRWCWERLIWTEPRERRMACARGLVPQDTHEWCALVSWFNAISGFSAPWGGIRITKWFSLFFFSCVFVSLFTWAVCIYTLEINECVKNHMQLGDQVTDQQARLRSSKAAASKGGLAHVRTAGLPAAVLTQAVTLSRRLEVAFKRLAVLKTRWS